MGMRRRVTRWGCEASTKKSIALVMLAYGQGWGSWGLGFLSFAAFMLVLSADSLAFSPWRVGLGLVEG